MTFEQLQTEIVSWAELRGIMDSSDTKTQLLKTMEELGETARAVLKNNRDDLIDGLGDTIVTLIIASELSGLNLVSCLESAFNVISNRKGVMKDKVFIKNE
jgi:NTP pyrophosphatase (non-canonical NTP hydrolase)